MYSSSSRVTREKKELSIGFTILQGGGAVAGGTTARHICNLRHLILQVTPNPIDFALTGIPPLLYVLKGLLACHLADF